ncbi:hypothetical protein [Xenorhabdus sp. SGI246]|uniref:hypothetical protein n=1 Tax=Xenorhabdus sp. SGI246 TaxID=3158263 RepID=UPI00349FBE6B
MSETKDVLTTTISKQADLIVGQRFLLTITLISKKVIDVANVNITFTEVTSNIIAPHGEIVLNRQNADGTAVTCDVLLTVNKNAQEKAPIKFTIKANGSTADPFVFNGTARTINPDTLPLIFDKEFLDIKNVVNGSINSDLKSMATTTLLDMNGDPLKNVPILIRSEKLKHLTSCKFKDHTEKEVPVKYIGAFSYPVITINSDEKGNIKFYIYPIQAHSMILYLETWILNVVRPVDAISPLFLVNTEIPDDLDAMPEPNILGTTSNLTSYSGTPNFYVGIYDYPNAAQGDYILFLTKEQDKERKYSGHYVIVGDPGKELGQDKYTYQVPYGIFKIGVTYEFNCVVILGRDGSSITSLPEYVTYMGGAKYSPSPDIERKYDACKVYTSLGVKDDEIFPGETIGYDNIKKYLDNPKGSTGLFIEVVGDKNSKTKVPLGAKVTLNMYIQASNRNIQVPYKMGTMPHDINSETNRYSLFFNIKLEDLVNILPYDNGGAGTIWFDYEFSVARSKYYGKVWEGGIDTRTGIPENDNN